MKSEDRKACGRIHTDNCSDAAKSLLDAFTWDHSPEGRAFWADIYDRLMDLSLSPDAEYQPLNASEGEMQFARGDVGDVKPAQTNDMQYDEQVNLNIVQPGDVAVLRCGGECEISYIKGDASGSYYEIWYKDFDLGRVYERNGSFGKHHNSFKQPIDIIAIKRCFDWSQAEDKMAFRHIYGDGIFWYIGPDFSCSRFVVVSDTKELITDESLQLYPKSELTRAPEHDAEVDYG